VVRKSITLAKEAAGPQEYIVFTVTDMAVIILVSRQTQSYLTSGVEQGAIMIWYEH